MLRDQRKLDDALAAYRKAIELEPDDPHAHVGLGHVLYDLRKLDDAQRAYHKAIESSQTNLTRTSASATCCTI